MKQVFQTICTKYHSLYVFHLLQEGKKAYGYIIPSLWWKNIYQKLKKNYLQFKRHTYHKSNILCKLCKMYLHNIFLLGESLKYPGKLGNYYPFTHEKPKDQVVRKELINVNEQISYRIRIQTQFCWPWIFTKPNTVLKKKSLHI